MTNGRVVGVLAIALFGGGAAGRASEYEEESWGGRGGPGGRQHELDDPAGRARARAIVDRERDPAAQLEILRVAGEEARRWGLQRLPGVETHARVSGNAWVNIGPDNAAFTINGDTNLSKIDSGRAKKILLHPDNPDILYFAVSGGGVWKTFNATATAAQGGPTWQPITEAIGSLSVGSLAMNPLAPDSLLLGLGDFHDVKTPGMLHSEDGGQTWSPLSPLVLSGKYASSGTTFTAQSVRDLQFDPTGAGGNVLAATDVGIFRAANFGQVSSSGWVLAGSTAGLQHLNACWSLAWVGPHTWLATCQDFGAPDVASGFGAGKLWRSTDDGASWSDLTSHLPGDPAPTAPPNPSQAKLVGQGRMTLAAAADKNTTSAASTPVYLLAGNNTILSGTEDAQKDVYRSLDGGGTWVSMGAYAGSGGAPTNAFKNASYGLQDDLDVMHGQADYNQMIVVDPKNPDRVFIGGNLAMLRINNARGTSGAVTFDLLSYWLPDPRPAASGGTGLSTDMYVHADWHAAAITYAGGSPVFWGGTDGGLYRSSNAFTAVGGAAVFDSAVNKGLVTHLVYSVASSAQRASTASCTVPAGGADVIYGGLQDNGTRLRASGTASSTFNALTGGDGFGVALGCAPSSTTMGSLLVATYVDQVSRSVDSGQTFKLANCCNESNGSCYVGAVQAPKPPNTHCTADATCQAIQADAVCDTRPAVQACYFPALCIDDAKNGPKVLLGRTYNFVMNLVSDLADPGGRTVMLPVTDDLCTLSGGHCSNPNWHHGTIWASQDGGATFASSARFTLTGGSVADTMPAPAYEVAADGKTWQNWVATSHAPDPINDNPVPPGLSTVYVTNRLDSTWLEAGPVTGGISGRYLPVKSAALDWSDATAATVWAASRETNLYCTSSACSCLGSPCVRNAQSADFVPATMGHVFRSTNARAGAATTWSAQGAAGSGLPYVPVNVIRVDPGDQNTVYAGTEIGLYRGTYTPGTDSTAWVRYGTGLPLVSITDIALAADGSSIRVSTFGRGFWEIFPKSGGSTAGVLGDGDLDQNQQIDAFDLVREAALRFTTSADDDYNAVGNLVGTVNAIDDADFAALLKKLGGRP